MGGIRLLGFGAVAVLTACGALLGLDEPVIEPSSATPDGTTVDVADASGETTPPCEDCAVDASCSPTCPATLVTTLPTAIVRIVIDGDVLYVIRGPKGAVARAHRVKVSPPITSEPLGDTSVTGAIALHGSGVYWGGDDGVRRIRRELDASPAVFTSAPRPVSALAIENNLLHYTTFDFDNTSPAGRFNLCDLPSCFNPSNGSSVNHATDFIFTTTGRVYVAWKNNAPLEHVPYVFQGLDDRLDAGAAAGAEWMATACGASCRSPRSVAARSTSSSRRRCRHHA